MKLIALGVGLMTLAPLSHGPVQGEPVDGPGADPVTRDAAQAEPAVAGDPDLTGPPDETPAVSGPLVISRGEGRAPIVIPRREELIFNVTLDLGILGSPKVGEVAILSRVDPFVDLASKPGEGEPLERASVTAIAVGQYAVYEVRDELSTQMLPQAWPQLIYRKTQTGTENRRRELTLGDKDGVFTATYRSDTHCRGCDKKSHLVSSKLPWRSKYHCKGCRAAKHRVWKDYRSKEVAPNSVDMLTATMIARAMVATPELDESEQLTVVTKLDSWEVSLTRGAVKTQSVRAGKFRATLVRLEVQRSAGEKDDDEDFSGLFGIHGSVAMWFDEATGIPVLIAGSVPAGPITLDVRIELKSYSGTPAGFGGK